MPGHEHPAEYPQASAAIPPGATLAFCTDGLVESRMRTLDEGIARLASALAVSPGGTLEETADGVVALMSGHDDIALLLIRPRAPDPSYRPGISWLRNASTK